MKKISRLNVFLFSIIGFALIVLRFLPHTEPQAHPQQKVSTRPNAQQSRTPSRFPTVWSSPLPAVPATTPASFYRTIIDNNLFRPLGWTPPRPEEPYRLTGTLIPRDANTAPKAFLLANATNTTHIVTLGDTFGKDTTVTAIESKQVTLQTAGQQRTLRLNTALWLNTSYTNRSPVRRQTPVDLSIPTYRRRTPEKP